MKQVILITGPQGTGKSKLLRQVMSFVTPDFARPFYIQEAIKILKTGNCLDKFLCVDGVVSIKELADLKMVSGSVQIIAVTQMLFGSEQPQIILY